MSSFRFGTRQRLKDHVNTIHDKLLLFKCQFEGCNASYTHSGSLSNHQRMQHKETYSQAARKKRLIQARMEKSKIDGP